MQGLCQEKNNSAFIYTSDIVNGTKTSFDGRPEMSQFECHRDNQLQIHCINRQDIQIQINASSHYKMPLLQL